MSPSAPNNKTSSRKHGKNSQQSNYGPGSLWERFTYSGGILLVTVGPIWAGMDAITWMAIYMGINAGILILCCLLGVWKSLRGSTPSSRRVK